jgi:hypothetical protein
MRGLWDVAALPGREGGEMYGLGRMGYAGKEWRQEARSGYAPLFPAVGLAMGVGTFFFAVASFDFFPFFFFLWWAILFFLVPAIGLSARGIAGFVTARSRWPLDNEPKEKELLKALARHGEITVAKAALDTSLSASEADRMLSRLAKERPRGGARSRGEAELRSVGARSARTNELMAGSGVRQKEVDRSCSDRG